MKRIQYTGASALSKDSVVGKAWTVGESYVTDDATAASLVAAGNFRDTTGLQPVLAAAAGATKTLAVSDAGTVIPITAASTVTIPASFAVDSLSFVVASGGTLTLKGATGVTLNGTSAGTTVFSQVGSVVNLTRTATNTFLAQSVVESLSAKLDVSSKATDALADAGTDDASYMTPAKTTRALDNRRAYRRIASVSDLRALTDTSITIAYLDGYDSIGDGGEGYVRVVSGVTAYDDGGVRFLDASGRVWQRELINNTAKLEHYGVFAVAKRNSTVSQSLLDTNTTRWAAACNGVVRRGGGELLGSVGFYHINGVGIIQDESDQSDVPQNWVDSISVTIRGKSRRFFIVQNHSTETALRVYGYKVQVNLENITFAGRGSATTGDLVEVQKNTGLIVRNVTWVGHGGVGFTSINAERMTFYDPIWAYCRKAYRWMGTTNESYIYNQQIINPGSTFDALNANLNAKSYSVNAAGSSGWALKSSGTTVQDLQPAASIDGPQNVRMIGGSIKSTQHHSGHLIRCCENVQMDNLYYEGYNGGTNPGVIVGGPSHKTTLSAAITAIDTEIPIVEGFHFPRACSTRAAAVAGNVSDLPMAYVIYDPADTSVFEYVTSGCVDWQAKVFKGVVRGVGGTTARAWESGVVIREAMRTAVSPYTFNSEVYLNDCHLASYQAYITGTTFSYDASKGETAGEVILGLIPDEFNTAGTVTNSCHLYLNKPFPRTGSAVNRGKVQHWVNAYSYWPVFTLQKALSLSSGPLSSDGSSQTSRSTYGTWGVVATNGRRQFPDGSNTLLDLNADESFLIAGSYKPPIISGRGGVGLVDNTRDNQYVVQTVSGTNTATMVAPGPTTLHGLHIGCAISHPGMPSNTSITNISGSTLTLSTNATKSVTDFANIQTRWMARYYMDGAYGFFDIMQNTGTGASQNWRSQVQIRGGSSPSISFYDPAGNVLDKVITTRQKGWTQDTGTAKRGAISTFTYTGLSAPGASYDQTAQSSLVTLVNSMAASLKDATETIKALKDTLMSHGLIGPTVMSIVLTSGSTGVSLPLSTMTAADITVGMVVSASGVPAGTTVVAKSTAAFTLSAAATASGTVTATFTS